jgi:hypothetical protein
MTPMIWGLQNLQMPLWNPLTFERIRRYWDIEGGLHQRLDVSGGEDASRVRNRNAILVLGILRHHHRPPQLTPETSDPSDLP